MSEHTTSDHTANVHSADNPYKLEEVKQFMADDTEAGMAIGKMLSLFFFYTVIVMAISSFATFYWVNNSSVQ